MPSPPAGRTLAVFHLAERSGPSVSLRNELGWLAGGGPLEVVVPGPGSVADDYGRFADVTVMDYSPLTLSEAWRTPRDIRTFRAHIRRTRPARVVVVTNVLCAVLVAARMERVPALLYAAELVPTGPGLRRRLGGALVLRAARSLPAAIVCCSPAVERQLGPRPGRPAIVAHPPVADSFSDGGRAAMRGRLGIPVEAECVVSAGSISRGRGQDVLIRAVPLLKARFPGIRVVIAGAPHPRAVDRGYLAELAELARGLGVSQDVVFAGFVERMADLYAAADVVANPARHEAFGRVAAEALLAGKPVVSTAVGGVPETLRDGVEALLVPPDDPGALAAGVATLMEDSVLAQRLVAAGAARVRSEFSERQSLESFARAALAMPPAAVG